MMPRAASKMARKGRVASESWTMDLSKRRLAMNRFMPMGGVE